MARESSLKRSDSFFAGDDRQIRWTIYDADTGGSPLDITGWTFDFDLRKNPDDAAALVSKTGVAPSNGPAGEVTITLADTDTESLAEDAYYYTLRRADAGNERVVAYGTFYVRRASLS